MNDPYAGRFMEILLLLLPFTMFDSVGTVFCKTIQIKI